MMEIKEKLNNLKEILKKMERVAVAFSGGVDSTFLLKVAHDVLGDDVIAITARSLTFPLREYQETVKFTKEHGIKHITIDSNELEKEEVYNNTIDRCYFCKYETFQNV